MTIDLHYSLGDVREEIFRMCALVVGRFNSTPPRTEYHFIWNAQTVSDLQREEKCSSKLSTESKMIPRKVSFLLAVIEVSPIDTSTV